MLSLPIAVVLILLAFYFKGVIRKRATIIYIIVTVLSVIAIFVTGFKPLAPIQKGAFGLSFFYVVMLAGALKDKSKLRSALMSVRKEFSIIGFIFISPHAINLFLKFLENKISLPIFGVIIYVIMIPLFITSFTVIRKKFKYQTWKKLQRFAYISYILLFVHLIVQSSNPNQIIYILMFVIYFGLKIAYEVKKYKTKATKKIDQK